MPEEVKTYVVYLIFVRSFFTVEVFNVPLDVLKEEMQRLWYEFTNCREIWYKEKGDDKYKAFFPRPAALEAKPEETQPAR